MKTKKFAVMLVAVAVFATACSDDDSKDSPKVEESPATVVAGTYNGVFSLYVMEEEQGADSASLILTATGDNIVSITVGVMDAMGSDLGPIVIDGVVVDGGEETYTLAADSIVVPNVPYGETTVNTTVSVEGEIDSERNFTATFNMILGAMPFPVVGYFTTIAE